MELTTVEEFDVENLIFSEPEEGVLSGGQAFRKVNMNVGYLDESVGSLIIPTKCCFSFRVQKSTKFGNPSYLE